MAEAATNATPTPAPAPAASSGGGRRRKVTLRSSDGAEYVVSAEMIAAASGTIRRMLEEGAGGGKDDVVVVVNLPDVVKGAALARVVEYCDHHGGADPGSALYSFPPVADGGFGRHGRTAFEREFLAGIPVDQGTFFDVMLAADYLAVQGLLDLTCSAMARQFNRPPERLRELFHVVDDFTADEEEEIRRRCLGPFDDDDIG